MLEKDRRVLRDLALKVAEIAALPEQKKTRELWRTNNDLESVPRPPVYMDQLPWHEINHAEEMRLACEDPFLRGVEQNLRQTLFRWNHFRCDMIVRPFYDLEKSVNGLNYGIHVLEDTCVTDSENDVISHAYIDQLKTSEEVQAMQADIIETDAALDAARKAQLEDIFGDVYPVRLAGVSIHSDVWDRITQMRSVTDVLEDLIEDPDLIIKTVKKFVWITERTIEQCEALGLLDPMLSYIHCTGAFTKDLPVENGLDRKATPKDCWSFGMAQMFTTVSPKMHEAYEIDLVKPLYDRFGLMYYGCCEPLHHKIGIIRKLSNVRKISVSPWADIDIAADSIGRDYVFSSKINPAFIAVDFSRDAIAGQVEHVLEATRRNGTPAELILKDVSTVQYDISRLERWCELVMSIIGA